MEASKSNLWQSLAEVPPGEPYQHFHLVFDDDNKALYAIHCEQGLLQYSFDKNTWNTVNENIANNLPADYFEIQAVPIAIDSQQTIYFGAEHDYSTSLSTLKIPTDPSSSSQWDIDEGVSNTYKFQGAEAIMINDELHIIGGYGNYNHLKYNKVSKKFDVLHDIEFCYPQLIKIKDKVISFGGYKNGYLDEIHEYNINDNTWSKLQNSVPVKLIIDGIAAILNEQYVLLFGGNHAATCHKEIWIYSVNDQSFKESKVECPGQRGGQVFKTGDPEQDELLVYGYIRSYWNDSFPPRDIINIIYKFFANEWIHLIERDGKHWRINMLDIVNNTK